MKNAGFRHSQIFYFFKCLIFRSTLSECCFLYTRFSKMEHSVSHIQSPSQQSSWSWCQLTSADPSKHRHPFMASLMYGMLLKPPTVAHLHAALQTTSTSHRPFHAVSVCSVLLSILPNISCCRWLLHSSFHHGVPEWLTVEVQQSPVNETLSKN